MSTIVNVKNLSKTFKVKIQKSGLKGTLKSLIKPEFNISEAVKNISFQIEKGERLAFIGPNGAGKSTTIKILTGILHPDRGEVNVLGHIPWKDRQKLSFKTGAVFGQKPQLWYHLPPGDTFELFGKIYEMDSHVYKKRVAELLELFEITPFINTPVRQLSLGQRMRCEMVASLLHNPEVIFLDEPTIGLDVVSKKTFRELIREMSEREQVTILLTSHDVGDIEKLCKRVIIINEGTIVYEGQVSALKRTSMKRKIVGVRFGNIPPEELPLEGCKIIKRGKYGLKLETDSEICPVRKLMDYLIGNFEIEDINVADPPLEEIIGAIYNEGVTGVTRDGRDV